MKKYSYILTGVAALVLASCTSEGNEPAPVVEEQVAATASAEIGGSDTRAVNANTFDVASTTAIGISCVKNGTGTVLASGDLMFNKFNNCKYVCTAASGKFTAVDNANTIFYQNTSEYQFKAYYPYTGSKGTEPTISLNTATKQDQAAQNSTLDVLYAEGAKGSKANANISFTNTAAFSHRMAKLIINLTLDQSSGFSDATERSAFLNGMQVFVNGFKHSGSFNTATNTISASGDPNTNWQINSTSVAAVNETVSTNQGKKFTLILIPQNQVSATFKIVYNGVTYQATTNVTPTSGQQITLPITVKKTGLQVGTHTITDWGSGSTLSGEATL